MGREDKSRHQPVPISISRSVSVFGAEFVYRTCLTKISYLACCLRLFVTPSFPNQSGNNLLAFPLCYHPLLQRKPLNMWLLRELMRSLNSSLSRLLSADVNNIIHPLRKLPHRTPSLPREPCPRRTTSNNHSKTISHHKSNEDFRSTLRMTLTSTLQSNIDLNKGKPSPQ